VARVKSTARLMSSEELATASIAPAEGEVHESENTEPQEGNTT
jgi:hypothetical protein